MTTGLLAKDSSFRLIVSGNIGVKEIERLIQKLRIDKEILADQFPWEKMSAISTHFFVVKDGLTRSAVFC